MGSTLYDELNKWLKSPLEKKVRFKGLIPSPPTVKGHLQSKEAEAVPRAVKINPNNWSGSGFKPEYANHWVNSAPYLVGQYAIDVGTLASLSVQSLAYRTGHSPFLDPTALRFSPEQAYIDLGRLSAWDRWRVLWTRVGAHYYQDSEPFDAHEEKWLK